MDKDREVWVYIQRESGSDIREASIELLGKAQDLAARIQATVAGLFLGWVPEGTIRQAVSFGANRVYVLQSPRLEIYTSWDCAQAVSSLARAKKPEIFLIAATQQGRDLAPRVASMLGVGLTADCTDLHIAPYKDPKTGVTCRDILHQIRPAWGGNVIATIVNPSTRPQMATVREGVMKRADPDHKAKGDIVVIDAAIKKEDVRTRVLEICKTCKTADLKGARVIVAGGAGMGSKKNFELIRRCAEVLGGEVGVTRAAVDAGFATHDHQIGQTGATVRPKLYIACGISGAVQHVAGMEESGKILAVNTDPEAPIFKIAHYGIIGDAVDVLQKLIRAYKRVRC